MFWTLEEYQQFIEAMKEKPISYYAFQILYWTGIRSGELLAITRADFDMENRILRINKTFQVIKGKEMITTPKTEKVIVKLIYRSSCVMKCRNILIPFISWMITAESLR